MHSPQPHATPPNALSGAAAELLQKIEQKTATLGVVGLGYVGLPLVRAAHECGLRIIGYDTDAAKIDKLHRGEAYVQHLGRELFESLRISDRFKATSSADDLRHADVIILCVPTPLGDHREPDLSFVINSTAMVATVLRPGILVVLESTTYPGTTRDEMLPILEKTGLKCGRDFFLAYSPEREDPGRAGVSTSTIPKLVGGVDEPSGQLALAFYSQFIKQPHLVSSAEVAEAAKLLENIYRSVNIALANEMKMVLADMGIDVWEVIAAASTKPFGFQPFYPGPGLGGHCIPIDPFYLTWKAKEIGRPTRFIELAGEVNSQMPHYVIQRTIDALNDDRKALNGAKVLILGVAYKPNIDDMRESPAAEIIELLLQHGSVVSYHDPHVPVFPRMRKYHIALKSHALTPESAAAADAVLIVTDHAAVDYAMIGRHARLIIDTRNAMARVPAGSIVARVVKA
jgi:UDP-N-acetyl-D-glucosamine dehydrogenase